MILDNRYDVRDLLYSDTSITLHRGYDQVLNRGVAIEQLQPSLAAEPEVVARFLETARALALVEVPYVAALYDQGEADGRPFLILEEALPQTVAAAAPLPVTQVITMMRGVVETVGVAQQRGATIPAITPEAVRFTPDGHVQIMQTGLATQTTGSGAMAALSHLLLVALTGSADGRSKTAVAPAFLRVIERARAGQYLDPAALLHDLEAAERQSTVQTVVVPSSRPDAPPAPPPLSAAGPVPPPLQSVPVATPGPRAARGGMWLRRPLVIGLIALLLVGSVLFLLRRPGTTAARPPAASTATASSVTAVSATAPPKATRTDGQPYKVATASGLTLNIRQGPSTASPVIGTAQPGTVVQVFDAPVVADNYTWVHIQVGNVDGWCVKGALQK